MSKTDAEKQNIKELEKAVKDVLDIMRGYFKMDVAALLILPQVFVFRLHQLAKEEQLPNRYRVLELEKMRLENIKDLCDVLDKLQNSDLDELQASMDPFLHEFEALIEEEVFEVIFKRLKNNNYSTEYLKEEQFGRAYLSLIKNIFGDSSHRGDYISSKIIREAFSNIKLSPGEYKILDPAFGIGESIIEFVKNQRDGVYLQIHGFEMNQEIYGYAVMNLISNGIYSFDLTCDNSIESDWHTDFDLVMSDLPIGNVEINLEGHLPKTSKEKMFEANFTKKTRTHLKENGEACFLVSNKILYPTKPPSATENEFWINGKLLKKVIALPAGAGKMNSNVSTNIVYFENNIGSGNIVEFYDLMNSTNYALNRIIEKIFTPFCPDEHVYQEITYEEIEENNYNLLPKQYVGPIHKEIKKLKKMGED
jgi:type I restriction-modification system DNA methylase subunit